MAGACPDANLIAAYLDSTLTAIARARLEEHASRCDSCQEVLGLAFSLSDAEREIEAPSAGRPERARQAFRIPLYASAIAIVAAAIATGVLILKVTREQPASQTAVLRGAVPPDRPVPASPAVEGRKATAPERDSRDASNRLTDTPGNRERRMKPETAASHVTTPPPEAPRAPAPQARAEQSAEMMAARNEKTADPAATAAGSGAAEPRPMASAPAGYRTREAKERGAPAVDRDEPDSAAREAILTLAKLDRARSSHATRKIGTRVFYYLMGYWVDGECGGYPGDVLIHSATVPPEILQVIPELEELAASDTPIIIHYGKANYVVRK
jgi:Putative zinc-finger